VKERGAREVAPRPKSRRCGFADDEQVRGVKVSTTGMFTGSKVGWSSANRMTVRLRLCADGAQGTRLTWDDVVLFDESFAFPDSRERWLTGVTRAAKQLTVVV
jgi:hypothetical protein